MQIFISHDLTDTTNLNQITQKLFKKGFEVYYDEKNLKTQDLDVFIIIVSKKSINSGKMKKEYDICIQNQPKINILPIILGRESELPKYLLNYKYTVVNNSDELDYELNLRLNQIEKLKPLVFICHSSKDKKRFVANFIENLKNYNVNPWYDDSEINGKNFIGKIDNAIKESECGIIIFSKNLEESKFAIRERDSLITKSIYENYTIIPIKIDNEAEIPQLINSINIIEIKDLTNYDFELNRILQIIFKNKQKNYLKTNLIKLPECGEIETRIFLELCEICLSNGFDIELDPEDIFRVSQKYYEERDFSVIEEKIRISLTKLEKYGYLNNEGGNVGRAFSSKSVTSKGFCFYFSNIVEDYENKYVNLISAILKNQKYNLNELVAESNLDYTIVEAILRIFRKHDYVFCKNDLTIIAVTSKGENYFEKVLEK